MLGPRELEGLGQGGYRAVNTRARPGAEAGSEQTPAPPGPEGHTRNWSLCSVSRKPLRGFGYGCTIQTLSH